MADMSVSSCIYPLRYKGGDGAGVTVKRRKLAASVKGVPFEAPPDIYKVVGNVQQAGPRELLRLPEGDRTKDSIVVHTQFALRTVDVQAGTPADRIVHNGREWEVVSIEDRTTNDAYVRAICVKVGQ